jgi:hypothetical protein
MTTKRHRAIASIEKKKNTHVKMRHVKKEATQFRSDMSSRTNGSRDSGVGIGKGDLPSKANAGQEGCPCASNTAGRIFEGVLRSGIKRCGGGPSRAAGQMRGSEGINARSSKGKESRQS